MSAITLYSLPTTAAPSPLSGSEPSSPSTAVTSLNGSSEHLPAASGHNHKTLGFSTRGIHIGSEANKETGAVIPPISLSTTYKQDAIGVHKGYEYTRSSNPNRNLLEAQLAAIEAGGHTALAVSSGTAATGLFIASLGAGAHILSVNDVYGGTSRYLRHVAGTIQGVATSFVDLESSTDETILAAFQENTRAVWIETPTNPTLRLIDIPRIVRLAALAPSRPLVLVDNTFMSPFFQSPLALGADVVLHSITKYINGHSDVLMGSLIVASPEAIAGKGGFPHHVDEQSGEDLTTRLRYLQNAMGAVPSSFDSWLTQRGAKTLAIRMKTHGANALRLAHWLSTTGVKDGLVKPGPGGVVYPGMPHTASGGRKGYELVRDVLMSEGARKWSQAGEWEGAKAFAESGAEGVPMGGMMSFRIADPLPEVADTFIPTFLGRPGPAPSLQATTAERFLTTSQLFSLAESLGGIESLAELPSLMTHAGLPGEARIALGITDDLVRLSIGAEEFEDLRADVESALRWAVKGEVWHEGEGWVRKVATA
ncbi:hypothetical protein DL93DRAFT_2084519 [Clavulina sp. PMI_390]|nr:hypothetical protein DL93DRAFT_2084519 [Clavulina sp. PMI_390]